MITPIKPKSTPDCAIDAIRAYILDNRLQPGDVLPTETVLAQKLGISRNILREAMNDITARSESSTRSRNSVRRLRALSPIIRMPVICRFLPPAGIPCANCLKYAAVLRLAPHLFLSGRSRRKDLLF